MNLRIGFLKDSASDFEMFTWNLNHTDWPIMTISSGLIEKDELISGSIVSFTNGSHKVDFKEKLTVIKFITFSGRLFVGLGMKLMSMDDLPRRNKRKVLALESSCSLRVGGNRDNRPRRAELEL